jgi:hypothetical protein
MVRALLLRRSLLALGAIALVFANEAAAQSFDPNIVSRIESFIPPSPETVLPTKTKKTAVKRTETKTVTVEEKKELTDAEREAKAKEMGVVVPLGLRSTTARKAYLNLRNVPTYRIVKRQKKTTRTITEIVEKKVPRKTVVRGIASTGYSYATNANQLPVGIVPDSIGNQNGNVLILIPAGREEDTLSILLGPTAVRYATLTGSSFDAANASLTYTRLLGRKQTAEGLATGGTARTDLLTIGLDGVSVYEPGFGPHQIAVATPSIGWSRSNIGLGNKLCGDKGREPYCYYADLSLSRCWKASPTSRARSTRPRCCSSPSAGGRRSRICRCRRRAPCKASPSRTIRAAGRTSFWSAAAISAGRRTRICRSARA